MATWDYASELGSLWWGRHSGFAAEMLAQPRLQSLVRHARDASPFYRELYAGLPSGQVALAHLPPVTKARLMARFDDWCADRRITREAVDAFLADRAHVG